MQHILNRQNFLAFSKVAHYECLKYGNQEVFFISFTLSLLEAIADRLCQQFGPKSGPTKCWSWSGYKPFDTLKVFLKEFWKSWFWKKSAVDNKRMKNFPASKEFMSSETRCFEGAFAFQDILISNYQSATSDKKWLVRKEMQDTIIVQGVLATLRKVPTATILSLELESLQTSHGTGLDKGCAQISSSLYILPRKHMLK